MVGVPSFREVLQGALLQEVSRKDSEGTARHVMKHTREVFQEQYEIPETFYKEYRDYKQPAGTTTSNECIDKLARQFRELVVGDGSSNSRVEIFTIVDTASRIHSEDGVPEHNIADELLDRFIDSLGLGKQDHRLVPRFFRDSNLPFCDHEVQAVFGDGSAAEAFTYMQYQLCCDKDLRRELEAALQEALLENRTECEITGKDNKRLRPESSDIFLRRSNLKLVIEQQRDAIERFGKALIIEQRTLDPKGRQTPIQDAVRAFLVGANSMPTTFATLVSMPAPISMWQKFMSACRGDDQTSRLLKDGETNWNMATIENAFRCGKKLASAFHDQYHSTCAITIEFQKQEQHGHEGESRLPLLKKTFKRLGSSGEVCKVEIAGEYCKGFGLNHGDPLVCAMKKLDPINGQHEWSVMEKLFHQRNQNGFVMPALASVKRNDSVYIFYPWAEFDLMEFMLEGNPEPSPAKKVESMCWYRGIWNGLEYILGGIVANQLGIPLACLHMDIKPRNIVLVREGESLIPQITDFGIASIESLHSTSQPEKIRAPDNCPHYPPEADKEDVANFRMSPTSVTIWQFGALMIYATAYFKDGKAGVLRFKRLLHDSEDHRLYSRQANGKATWKPEIKDYFDTLFDQSSPLAGSVELTSALEVFVKGLLHCDPRERTALENVAPTFQRILLAVNEAVFDIALVNDIATADAETVALADEASEWVSVPQFQVLMRHAGNDHRPQTREGDNLHGTHLHPTYWAPPTPFSRPVAHHTEHNEIGTPGTDMLEDLGEMSGVQRVRSID